MVASSSNYFHFLADAQLLFTKELHSQSSDFKMLQHGGYTESEEVNRTNKRQGRYLEQKLIGVIDAEIL